MKIIIIVNPNGGRRRGLAAAESAHARLSEAGFTVALQISQYPGHTYEIASTIARETPSDTIIGVIGGDGTLFEVVTGLFSAGEGIPPPFPLAVFPLGTGNSFSRDVAIHSPEDTVEAIIRGSTRRIDVARLVSGAGTHYFVNMLGAGFVTNVASRAHRMKHFGNSAYTLAVLRETIDLESDNVVLTVDGERIDRQGHFIEICNSRYTAGNMLMSPDSRIDDGILEVVLLKAVRRAQLLTLLPKVFSGRHVQTRHLEVFSGRSIRLETQTPWRLTPDGEVFGSTPVYVDVVPRALEVFAG